MLRTAASESTKVSTAEATSATKASAKSAKTPAAAAKRCRIGCGQQSKSTKDNRCAEDPAGDGVRQQLHCIAELSFHGFGSFFIVRKSTRIVPFGMTGSNKLAGISAGNFQSEKTAVYCGDSGRLA